MHQNIVKPTSVKKYMQALNIQDEMINQMEKFLDNYHAFLCPVSAVTAFKHHPVTKNYGNFNIYNNPLSVNGKAIHYYMATQGYTTPFTLTENPVLTMPVSLTKDALPIGIQIIGKRYSDFRLLKIGSAINKYVDTFKYPLE